MAERWCWGCHDRIPIGTDVTVGSALFHHRCAKSFLRGRDGHFEQLAPD